MICYYTKKKEENSMEKESIETIEINLREIYENLKENFNCFYTKSHFFYI